MAAAAPASSAKEVLPPSLTSTSEPPPVFDGTTRLYVAYHFPELQGLQDKIKIVAIDLADRPAWYKEKIYPENKVGLLNVDGFYDPLLLFIDLAVNEGFITEEARHIIISAPTAKELVMKLEGCVPKYKIGLVWEDQNQKQNKPGP